MRSWRSSVNRSCAAAGNEMLVAMHQAGLSPRTIRRVTDKLDHVVLPYVDDLRNPDGGLKNAGNAQHVRDGDIWVQEYLTGHSIPCYEIGEVET
nr:MAG TPA: Mga helix-turn-helix domain [Caudoviricetes sp.]